MIKDQRCNFLSILGLCFLKTGSQGSKTQYGCWCWTRHTRVQSEPQTPMIFMRGSSMNHSFPPRVAFRIKWDKPPCMLTLNYFESSTRHPSLQQLFQMTTGTILPSLHDEPLHKNVFIFLWQKFTMAQDTNPDVTLVTHHIQWDVIWQNV